ncbi:MAG: molybdenum cofactor guanylyltransferase [Candidatus Brocadiaceae bacterium]|nr:molybdenum cofactor guanylyltransferase [Candidatus Brocadiaceae bacterium]
MTAIILTGGQNKRMGSNKAFLQLGDTIFIEHQISILHKIFNEIILSTNDFNLYKHLKLPMVSDIVPKKGPLSGIYSGLIHAKSKYSFVIACDMPFINEKFIIFLKKFLGDYDIIAPETTRGIEPLHAFYSKNCIPQIYHCIKQDKLRILDFYQNVRVKLVNEETLKVMDISTQSLINLNTPEDYGKYCNSN